MSSRPASSSASRRPTTPTGGGEWADIDDIRTALWLSQEYDLRLRTPTIAEAVQVLAAETSVHPVRDYLEALTWDGTERLNNWLNDFFSAGCYGGEPHRAYLARAGTLWLTQAVARIYQPGCRAHGVLILEGQQGLGKSSALAILGGEWFSDTPIDLNSKDAYQQLNGVWIHELAELDAFNRAESTRAKSFFSSAVDNYREVWARRNLAHRRQCVFAGTTNQQEYFRDPTGNRRYWPVRCVRYDSEAFSAARDQLWAEACAVYKASTPWWPQREDVRLFEAEQEYREIADPWEAILGAWVTGQIRAEFTMTELLEEALKVEIGRIDQHAMAIRIGRCMLRLGFVKRQLRRNGSRFWYVLRDD